MNNYFSKNLEILTAYCDSSPRVNPVKMMTWFEELAEQNASEMNIDGKTIRKSYNAFWIIKRVRLELNSTIEEEDEVTLKTWPSEAEGL